MDALHKAFLEFQVILTEDGKTYKFDTREELQNTSLTFQEHLNECAEILFPITDDMKAERKESRARKRNRFKKNSLKVLKSWRDRKMDTKKFQPFDWFRSFSSEEQLRDVFDEKVVKPFEKYYQNQKKRDDARETFKGFFQVLKKEFKGELASPSLVKKLAKKAVKLFGNSMKGFIGFIFYIIELVLKKPLDVLAEKTMFLEFLTISCTVFIIYLFRITYLDAFNVDSILSQTVVGDLTSFTNGDMAEELNATGYFDVFSQLLDKATFKGNNFALLDAMDTGAGYVFRKAGKMYRASADSVSYGSALAKQWGYKNLQIRRLKSLPLLPSGGKKQIKILGETRDSMKKRLSRLEEKFKKLNEKFRKDANLGSLSIPNLSYLRSYEGKKDKKRLEDMRTKIQELKNEIKLKKEIKKGNNDEPEDQVQILGAITTSIVGAGKMAMNAAKSEVQTILTEEEIKILTTFPLSFRDVRQYTRTFIDGELSVRKTYLQQRAVMNARKELGITSLKLGKIMMFSIGSYFQDPTAYAGLIMEIKTLFAKFTLQTAFKLTKEGIVYTKDVAALELDAEYNKRLQDSVLLLIETWLLHFIFRYAMLLCLVRPLERMKKDSDFTKLARKIYTFEAFYTNLIFVIKMWVNNTTGVTKDSFLMMIGNNGLTSTRVGIYVFNGILTTLSSVLMVQSGVAVADRNALSLINSLMKIPKVVTQKVMQKLKSESKPRRGKRKRIREFKVMEVLKF